MKKTAFQLFGNQSSRVGDVLVQTSTSEGVAVTVPVPLSSMDSSRDPFMDDQSESVEHSFLINRQSRPRQGTTTNVAFALQFLASEQQLRAQIEKDCDDVFSLCVSLAEASNFVSASRKRAREPLRVAFPIFLQKESLFLDSCSGSLNNLLAKQSDYSFKSESREAVREYFSRSFSPVLGEYILKLITVMITRKVILDHELDSFVVEALSFHDCVAQNSPLQLAICGVLAAWHRRCQNHVVFFGQLVKLTTVLHPFRPFIQLWLSALVSYDSCVAAESGAIVNFFSIGFATFSRQLNAQNACNLLPLLSVLLSALLELFAKHQHLRVDHISTSRLTALVGNLKLSLQPGNHFQLRILELLKKFKHLLEPIEF